MASVEAAKGKKGKKPPNRLKAVCQGRCEQRRQAIARRIPRQRTGDQKTKATSRFGKTTDNDNAVSPDEFKAAAKGSAQGA